MNKIIQINLAGQAVSIDESAYATLSQYLTKLENHFKSTESGDEILADIEARIAELFYNKTKNNAFITEAHVEEAIELMGMPEDLGLEDEGFEQATSSHTSYSKKSKKLFRDPDDRVIGGVCSGIGAYLGLDASIVRIITVLLIFAAGVPIILYIILWIAMPIAKTAQDKYRMHGDANTISDIAHNIRNEAQTVANTVRDEAQRMSNEVKKNSSLNSTTRGIANGIDRVFKAIAKIFGGGVLTLLVIIGIMISVLLLSNATGGLEIDYNGSDLVAPTIIKSPTFNWIWSISLLSLILIPIGTACYSILQYIFNITGGVNFKGVFLAWLLSLAIFIAISIYAAGNLNIEMIQEFGEQIERMSNETIERV